MGQESGDSVLLTPAVLKLEINSLKELVNTRLNSMEKAIEKSESNFTKQVEKMDLLITTSVRLIDSKIGDLQTRTNLHEGSSKGMKEMYGWIVGIAGVMIAVATFFVKKGGI